MSRAHKKALAIKKRREKDPKKPKGKKVASFEYFSQELRKIVVTLEPSLSCAARRKTLGVVSKMLPRKDRKE